MAFVLCRATIVLGKQHAEGMMSFSDDVHKLSVARPQSCPSADELLLVVARYQREIVQYRLPPAQALQWLGAILTLSPVDDHLRLGSDT